MTSHLRLYLKPKKINKFIVAGHYLYFNCEHPTQDKPSDLNPWFKNFVFIDRPIVKPGSQERRAKLHCTGKTFPVGC